MVFRLIFWSVLFYLAYRVVKYFIAPVKRDSGAVREGEAKKKEKKRTEHISDAKFKDIE